MTTTSIEDRLAINDLFVRYTTALDAGDVETIVGCFTEDGLLEARPSGLMRAARRSVNSPGASPDFTKAARNCGTSSPTSS